MRLLFIIPNWGSWTCLSIGLSYLISSLEKKHEIRLLDMTFNFKDHQGYLLKELRENKPDVAGISVNSFSLPNGIKVAKWIKEFNPGIKVILGGVHPTLLPEETIKEPNIDAICIGEGEESFLEYLEKIEDKKAPEVKGIWYKDDGQIIRNPLRPFKENLDELPFPNWDYWQRCPGHA